MEYKDNEIQGSWNTGIIEYRDNRVQGEQNTRIKYTDG